MFSARPDAKPEEYERVNGKKNDEEIEPEFHNAESQDVITRPLRQVCFGAMRCGKMMYPHAQKTY